MPHPRVRQLPPKTACLSLPPRCDFGVVKCGSLSCQQRQRLRVLLLLQCVCVRQELTCEALASQRLPPPQSVTPPPPPRLDLSTAHLTSEPPRLLRRAACMRSTGALLDALLLRVCVRQRERESERERERERESEKERERDKETERERERRTERAPACQCLFKDLRNTCA
jgi:hypothetical protein